MTTNPDIINYTENKPLVSAIVSTYNSERFINGKIEDLLTQTIANKLEIIIVNSGSQQNEDAIIQEYLKSHENIKYIFTEQRETVYKAWNRGIKIAKGEFITNSNTDDRLKNDAYEVLLNTLQNNEDVALVYADQYLSNEENETFDEAKRNKLIEFPEYSHLRQLERCLIGSQPMWRASLHLKDNLWFNESYEVSGDHEFELQVSERYKILHIPLPLGVFYKSPSRSNKETENMLRTRFEVEQVTTRNLQKYLENKSEKELIELRQKFNNIILLPIIFSELLVRIDRILFPGLYRRFFKHSIEFVYFLNILIRLKFGEVDKAIKLCQKYLRFKKSIRIKKTYSELINKGR